MYHEFGVVECWLAVGVRPPKGGVRDHERCGIGSAAVASPHGRSLMRDATPAQPQRHFVVVARPTERRELDTQRNTANAGIEFAA